MLPASLYVGTTTVIEDSPAVATKGAYEVPSYDEGVSDQRPLSALPSPLARFVAFVSILLAGLAGGIIGYALVDIQYDGNRDVVLGIGVLAGSVVAAGGTAIIAVLVLRAVGEWRDIADA